jgi:thioredoxin-dependent peroxiredoxin
MKNSGVIEVGTKIPTLSFQTRVLDENITEGNPYIWQEVTTDQLFSDKRVVLFSLPGAFTPTCSTYQLPGFEKMYNEFREVGIDEIYCVSVNDSFVMNQWGKWAKLKNVKLIPDGSALLTMSMNMLVSKDNLGFGQRSWRYAVLLNDGVVEKSFIEPGISDNCETDPYGETSPENVFNYIIFDSPVKAKPRDLQLELFDGGKTEESFG